VYKALDEVHRLERTKYIVWNGDGEELERVSSFEEAKRLMDHYIEIDAMAGDIEYD